MGQLLGKLRNSDSTTDDQSSGQADSSFAIDTLTTDESKSITDDQSSENPSSRIVDSEEYDRDPFEFTRNSMITLGKFLGMGRHGTVYKGTIENLHHQDVAIKMLFSKTSSSDLRNACRALSRMNHPNIVRLLGYCDEGNHHQIIYEFVSMNTLDFHLHGTTKNDLEARAKMQHLDWETRMRIAHGVAKGLEYLHEKVKPAMTYGYLSSSDILLEEDFSPKLSGFGLGKEIGPSEPKGTRWYTGGYFAPEYELTREYTIETDVYCFGIVLFELLTGKRAFYDSGTHGIDLVDWLKKNRAVSCDALKDSRLNVEYTPYKKAFRLAMSCTLGKPSLRPKISGAVFTIEDFMGWKRVGPRSSSLLVGQSEVQGQCY